MDIWIGLKESEKVGENIIERGGRLLKGGSEQCEGLHFFYSLLHALNRILVLN